MKSTFKDERQMESSLFLITGMITWIVQDLSLAVVSSELKAVMPTEESVSHKGEAFVQETEATISDYRGVLELWSTNGYALSEV